MDAAADLPTSADHAAVADLLAAARAGDRRAIGRLLSLAEVAAADPRGEVATGLSRALDRATPATGAPSLATGAPGPTTGAPGPATASEAPRVIGLTGPPGAGKSTLAGTLVTALRERGRRVWVLAVDPSSPVTGGALLGDRIRMAVAGDPGVVVRSLASRGAAGGVAAAVPWAVRIAASLGADDVLVETVGSGQADVSVAATADVTVLAVPPGLGDEVQALKAGIAEVADIVCVTKGDRPDADTAVRQWRGALGAGPDAPPVVVVSALAGDVSALLTALDDMSRAAATLPARGPRADPALVGALRAARRAAGAGSVSDTLIHLGEALRHGHRPGDTEPVTVDDLRGLDEAGGMARLVEHVAARLAPTETSELDDPQG